MYFCAMTANPEVFLSQSDFFSAMNSEHRRQVASICLPKNLKKRELLFSEGDKGYGLFFCAFGSIQLFKTSADGQEVVIRVIKPGELFAEVILFEQDRYPVSALALENSLLFILPRIQFECLLEDSDFRKDFISNLLGKLRYLAEQVRSLTTEDVQTRLFRFLKEQYHGASEFRINLTKKDVAAAIGTTPETLSRLLLRLRNDNLLVWEGKRIRFGKTESGADQ